MRKNILISQNISRNVACEAFFNVREGNGTGIFFPDFQGNISSSSLLQFLYGCYHGELRESFHKMIPTLIPRVKKIMNKNSCLTNHTVYQIYHTLDLHLDCLCIFDLSIQK